MRTLKILVLSAFLAAATAVTIAAQTLTLEQFQAAIERGLKSRPSEIGLDFKTTKFNSGKAVLRSFVRSHLSHGLDSRHGLENFGVVMYTPLAWVERQAAIAASRDLPFVIGNVTDEMRRPVLRVYVKPLAQHTLLRDDNKASVQPLAPGKQLSEFINFGRQVEFNMTYFEFELNDVARLKALGGFHIRVEIRPGQFEEFEVKKKHLDRLPL